MCHVGMANTNYRRIVFLSIFFLAAFHFASANYQSAYKGCYKENRRSRVFTVNTGWNVNVKVTSEGCFKACSVTKYKYAGTTRGQWCFCSNTLGNLVQSSNAAADCNLPCNGDSGQTCGSHEHVSVYDCQPPIDIRVTASPKIIVTGSTTEFQPVVTTDAASHKLAVNYDDGAGQTDFISLGDNLLNRTYYESGEYHVTVFATSENEALEPVETQVSILAQSRVNGVEIDCPPVVPTYDIRTCNVAVLRGSDMQLTVTYTDGDLGPQISQTFQIGDALEFSMGNPIQEKMVVVNESNVGLVVLPSNPARHNGRLVGFEYLAVISGVLLINVYRPSCGPVYCPDEGTCSSSCSVSCPASDQYCMDDDNCGTASTPPAFSSTSYSLLKDVTVTLSSGHHFYDVTDLGVAIKPGDIIGYDTSSQLLAVPGVSSGPTDNDCSADLTTCTDSAENHMLRAIYTVPATAAVEVSMTQTGTVVFTAEAENINAPLSGFSDSNSTTIDVQEGVNASIIDVNRFLEANAVETLSVLPFSGTTASVSWDVGDGSATLTSLTETVSHTYTVAGAYNLTANISNAISWKINSTEVYVEERIAGLAFPVPTVIESSLLTNIPFSLTTGTDYTCTLTVRDSAELVIATKSFDQADINANSAVALTLSSPGAVTTELFCANNINSDGLNSTGVVVERLSGVELSPAGAIMNEEFRINLTWVEGTDVSVTLTYDSIPEQHMTIVQHGRYALTGWKKESMVGLHSVYFKAENQLGSVARSVPFVIEVEIINLYVSCVFASPVTVIEVVPFTVIPLNTAVNCDIQMDAGTSVQMEVQYGEGTVYPYSMAVGDPWDYNALPPLSHTYTVNQMCNLTIKVWNSLSTYEEYFPVLVLVPVDGVTIVQPPTLPFYPPALAEIVFNTPSPVPNAVTLNVSWGDLNTDIVVNHPLTTPLNHTYKDRKGYLNLTCTLSNLVSSITLSLTVQVISPIIQDVCFTRPPAAAPGDPVDLIWKAFIAPSSNLVSLTFDCGVGTPTTQLRDSSSPDGEDSVPCIYPSVGTYHATVRAVTDLEDVTSTYVVKVINPVKESFVSILTNSPMDIHDNSNPPCTLELRVDYTDATLPDEAVISVNYGDGTEENITFAAPVTVYHTYSTHYNYSTTVRVYNLASEATFQVMTGCYERFTGESMVVRRQPDIPNSAPVDGFGAGKNQYSVLEALNIGTSLTTGTFVWWEVAAIAAGNVIICNSTDYPAINFEITEPGVYSITLQARNPKYMSNVMTYEATFLSPVSGTMVDDYNIVTGPGMNKRFNVSMFSYGTDMCVAVHSGKPDETNLYLYGGALNCSTYEPSLTSRNGWQLLVPTHVTGIDVTQAFEVDFTYGTESGYTLTVYAENLISSETLEYPFVVSSIRCSRPTVAIRLMSGDPWDPQRYKRGQMIKVSGITDINCDTTFDNLKWWEVERRDENTNEFIEDIDLSSVSTRDKAEISIPARFFRHYGLYLFRYRVTMDLEAPEGVVFWNDAITYVMIEKSDLMVQLYMGGNSMMSVGPNDVFVLNPTAFSFDPDIDLPNTLDGFNIACRDVTLGETFPEKGVTVFPTNQSDMTASMLAQPYSGCFRQGAGWFSYFSGVEYIQTNTFAVNHTYEFLVEGYKDTRTSFFIGQLDVVSSTPPKVFIEPKIDLLCWPGPKGKVFNANYQQGLKGIVEDPCSGCSYSHTWEMYAYDHDYCIINECWRDLSYLANYIEGIDSGELTIHTTVFEHYEEVDEFEVRLRTTNDGTGATASAILTLVRNRPPGNGSCIISPLAGTAGVTQYQIDCENFSDTENNEIIDYKITCEANGATNFVTNGPQPHWEGLLLPVGDSNNDYNISVFVTVTDDRGAFATYRIPTTVKNEPMAVNDVKEMMRSYSTSDNDTLDYAYAIGDLTTIANLANAFTQQLTSMRVDDEFTVYRGMGTILSFQATELGNTEQRPGFHATEVYNETAIEMFEEDRDNAAQFMEKIVSALDRSTAESTEDIITVTSVLSAISAGKETLNRATQGKITSILGQSINNLKKHITSVSVEQVKTIAEFAFTACDNVQESATDLADFPTISDLDAQDAAVPSFSSNFYTKQDDVPMLKNDKDQKKAGKKIMHKDDQTVFISDNLKNCKHMRDDVTDMLASAKPISMNPTKLESNNGVYLLYKNTGNFLVGKTMETEAGDVSIPSDVLPPELKNHVLLMTVAGKSSTGTLSQEGDADTFSRSLTINYKHENGTAITLENLATPIELTLNQDPNKPPFNESATEPSDPMITEGHFAFIHEITVAKPGAIVLKFRNMDLNATSQLLVMLSHNEDPVPHGNVKYACSVPRFTSRAGQTSDSLAEDAYTCFVDRNIVGDLTGTWKVGVRQLHVNELDKFQDNTTLPLVVPATWLTDKNFTTTYTFLPFVIVCSHTADGSVIVGYNAEALITSTENKTICHTRHLTSFAGGWVVAPNAIDWNFVFANADFLKNPTLYVTEMVIVVAYIAAMIWARRADKLDLSKLGLAPLLDNDPRDKYYYEILVETGMRRNGGTESKVHFILSGEEEETEVRTFTDKKRKIFQRGNTDGFLLATPCSLGALMYLRIWHDNSGKGPAASWYLNHILVRDVHTDKKYYFICNRWFAVEEDDGQVDRVIPVAGKEQMTEFSHLFKERAQKNLSDGHLWFSVVARPPQSRFTRCQRVSCCLCLLFTSMLANAMFYKSAPTDSNAYTFGPFAITPEQIFIGIASNLIIFPVNFLLITLFRKSRPRKLRPSRVEEALKSMPERTTSMTDVNPRVKSSLDYERPGSSFLMDAKRSQSSMSRPESSMSYSENRFAESKLKKKKKLELPWWFTVVAWIILCCTVLVSMFFVTMYGIQFQDMLCKMWITSMLVSFFTSVFLTQPLKVFLFAIIFSLIIKNPGGDEDEDNDEEERRIPDNDEEYLHTEDDGKHTEDDGYGLIAPQRPMYKPKPPDSKALESARQQRLKEIQMWSVIREILFYAFFLWILLVISYRSVSTNSYNYKFNMEKVFIHTNDTKYEFTKVKNVQDYWVWAKSGMLRGLRAGPYYNNFPPFYLRGYINDKVSRLMGYAVLRQVRVKPGSCSVPGQMKSIITECNEEYVIATEEDRNFGPSWTDISTANTSREEYTYQSGSSLNGYPFWGEMAVYGGGGYVVRLDRDYHDMVDQFTQLEDERWIDEYTRAVFLEFTVYNPSINLFAISTLVSEYRPSGGVFSSYRFEPCMLLPYMSPVLLFQLVCEVIYVAFTLYFVFKEFRNIYRQKLGYFKQFWNLVELGICGMSVTAIVIYFYRFVCINRLTEYFKETHGNEYMKFQYVGYWTELFNYIIGFLVFFASLKFLKLLRFNKKISLLTSVLSNSGRDLIHFSVIFNIVFMAFIQLFYLTYHAHLEIFKTMVSSVESGIVMMMGKFDIYKMLAVNSWLTQIFLFLFVVSITFIVVNMFLSILNDTFCVVRSDIAKQENDYEIVDFMMNRFKLWTGLGSSRSTTISPTDLEKERTRHYQTLEGKIDYFPDQIDRFLASVSNMYMEKTKFDTFLDKGLYNKMAMKANNHRPPGPQLPNMANYRHLEPHPRHPGTTRLSSGLHGMTDVQTD